MFKNLNSGNILNNLQSSTDNSGLFGLSAQQNNSNGTQSKNNTGLFQSNQESNGLFGNLLGNLGQTTNNNTNSNNTGVKVQGGLFGGLNSTTGTNNQNNSICSLFGLNSNQNGNIKNTGKGLFSGINNNSTNGNGGLFGGITSTNTTTTNQNTTFDSVLHQNNQIASNKGTYKNWGKTVIGKNHAGIKVESILFADGFKKIKKSLEELRAEDYLLMQNNQLPDDIKQKIQAKIKSSSSASSGFFGTGSGNSNILNGNNQSSISGGLFGKMSNQNSNQTFSFGNKPTNITGNINNSSTGLFGGLSNLNNNSSNGNNTGIFNCNTKKTNNNSGLFSGPNNNNNPNQMQTNNIFGNSTVNQPINNTHNSGLSGLFQQVNNQGLFNNVTANQQNSVQQKQGGLFNGIINSNTQKTTQQNQQTTGIFNNVTNNQQQGIFTNTINTNTNPTQQLNFNNQQQQTFGMNFNNGNTNNNLRNGNTNQNAFNSNTNNNQCQQQSNFMQQQQQAVVLMFAQVTQFLQDQERKNSMNKIKAPETPDFIKDFEDINNQPSYNSDTFLLHNITNVSNSYPFNPFKKRNTFEIKERKYQKRFLPFHPRKPTQIRKCSFSKKISKRKTSLRKGFFKNAKRTYHKTPTLKKNGCFLGKRNAYYTSSKVSKQFSILKRCGTKAKMSRRTKKRDNYYSLQKKNEIRKYSKKLYSVDGKRQQNFRFDQSFSTQSLESHQSQKENKQLIKSLELYIQVENPINKKYLIEVEDNCTVEELKMLMKEKTSLTDQNKYLKLCKENKELNDDLTLKEALIQNKDILTIVLEDEPEQILDYEVHDLKRVQMQSPKNLLNHDYQPIYTTKDFTIKPSIDELRQKTATELQNVENFTIENEFAKVEFLELVDLTNVNLDKLAILKHKMVDVYPVKYFSNNEKPLIGQKLNQPALITYKQMYLPEKYKNPEKYKKKIIKWTQKKKIEFNTWDAERGLLVVRTQHF